MRAVGSRLERVGRTLVIVAIGVMAILVLPTSVARATATPTIAPGATLEVVTCSVAADAPRGLSGPDYLHDRITAPISSQRASLVIDVHWEVKNDEDPGVNAYWALDTYSTTLLVWSIGAGSHAGQFYYVQSFSGTFFVPSSGSKGYAISPDYGTPEPESAVGTFHGAWYGYIGNTTLNASYGPMFGYLGTKNYGGTIADIELGGYDYPQTGDASPFSWFGYFTQIDFSNAYSQTFSFVYQISPVGNVWSTFCYVQAAYTPYVDDAFAVGDILTR